MITLSVLLSHARDVEHSTPSSLAGVFLQSRGRSVNKSTGTAASPLRHRVVGPDRCIMYYFFCAFSLQTMSYKQQDALPDHSQLPKQIRDAKPVDGFPEGANHLASESGERSSQASSAPIGPQIGNAMESSA